MRARASIFLLLGSLIIILGFWLSIGGYINIEKDFGKDLLEEFNEYQRLQYYVWVYADFILRNSTIYYLSSIFQNYPCDPYSLYKYEIEDNKIKYIPCLKQIENVDKNLIENIYKDFNNKMKEFDYYKESKIYDSNTITAKFLYSYATELYYRKFVFEKNYTIQPYILFWNCFIYDIYNYTFNKILETVKNPENINFENVEIKDNYIYININFKYPAIDIINLYRDIGDIEFNYSIIIPCSDTNSCNIKKEYYYECFKDENIPYTSEFDFAEIDFSRYLYIPKNIEIKKKDVNIDFEKLNLTIKKYGWMCKRDIQELKEYPILVDTDVYVEFYKVNCTVGYRIEKKCCYDFLDDCRMIRNSFKQKNEDGYYIKDVSDCYQNDEGKYYFTYKKRYKYNDLLSNNPNLLKTITIIYSIPVPISKIL